MKVLTKPYGEMEIDDLQRMHFPRGIFGFEELREFALLDAAQTPFYWLQSLEKAEIAFVVIDPVFFRPDYVPDVDPAELAEIGIASPGDILLLAIVTIPANSSRMTANLQGPLLINRLTRVGRQSVSMDPRWGVRHAILEELALARQEA